MKFHYLYVIKQSLNAGTLLILKADKLSVTVRENIICECCVANKKMESANYMIH